MLVDEVYCNELLEIKSLPEASYKTNKPINSTTNKRK